MTPPGINAWTGGVDHIIALKGMEGGGNGRVLNFATRYRSSEKTYTVVLGDDGEYHAAQGQGDVAADVRHQRRLRRRL